MMEINWVLLSVQVITFIVAMLIIWKLFWGPLTKFMQARARQIADDLKCAENGKREIEAMEGEYHRRISELEARAQQEIKEALASGAQAKDQIMLEARQEAKRILDKAQADLVREREGLMRELRSHMTDISLQAVEKLLGQNLDVNVQRRLLDQFIRDVEKVRPQT